MKLLTKEQMIAAFGVVIALALLGAGYGVVKLDAPATATPIPTATVVSAPTLAATPTRIATPAPTQTIIEVTPIGFRGIGVVEFRVGIRVRDCAGAFASAGFVAPVAAWPSGLLPVRDCPAISTLYPASSGPAVMWEFRHDAEANTWGVVNGVGGNVVLAACWRGTAFLDFYPGISANEFGGLKAANKLPNGVSGCEVGVDR